MKVLGLILEINPFHNGHKFFIEESIKNSKPDIVIAITSTSFTMRGDVSLLTKFDKTKILLNNNVDLVIELPVIKTLNSADYFADQTVKTLIDFGITDLAFGIEDGKSDELYKIYDIIKSQEFNNYLNNTINNHLSYKENYSIAFNNFCNDPNLTSYLDKPNFTLALQYLTSITKYNKDITIHPITRIDNYYNNDEIQYKSAYNLRKMINNNEDISNYIVYNPNLIQKINYDLLLNLIKYKFLIDNNQINMYYKFDLNKETEGIIVRVKKQPTNSDSLIGTDGIVTAEINNLVTDIEQLTGYISETDSENEIYLDEFNFVTTGVLNSQEQALYNVRFLVKERYNKRLDRIYPYVLEGTSYRQGNGYNFVTRPADDYDCLPTTSAARPNYVSFCFMNKLLRRYPINALLSE